VKGFKSILKSHTTM